MTTTRTVLGLGFYPSVLLPKSTGFIPTGILGFGETSFGDFCETSLPNKTVNLRRLILSVLGGPLAAMPLGRRFIHNEMDVRIVFARDVRWCLACVVGKYTFI